VYDSLVEDFGPTWGYFLGERCSF